MYAIIIGYKIKQGNIKALYWFSLPTINNNIDIIEAISKLIIVILKILSLKLKNTFLKNLFIIK